MKHNLLKSVIISVILLMGVSNAWSIGFNKGNIVFRAQGWNNPTHVYLCVGRDENNNDYTQVWEMGNIPNTNLYHVWVNVDDKDDNWWNGCTYFAVIGNSNTVTSGSWGSSNLTKFDAYTTAYTAAYDVNSKSGIYFFNKNNNTVKGGSFSIDYKDSHSGIPTFNATQAAKVRNTIKDSYAIVSGNWPATLELQGTYMSGDANTTQSSISSTTSADGDGKKVYGAVVTGKITHTYGTITGNYIFEGWGTGDTPSTTNASHEYNITANTTVYAFFTKAHTVTYSRTPSSAANAPTTTPSVTSGSLVASGTSVTFNAKVANTGYTWKGWYSNNTGTGNVLSTNLAYTRSITATTDIYAVYTANTYTVKFDANGGTGTMSNQNFTYGTAKTLTANAFTRTGYTFAGWATSANENKVYNDKQSVSNLSSTNGATVTLYAKWTANTYQVKFNGNGNTSGSMSNQSFTYDEAAKALTTNAFKKTGYIFAGWNTAANGSGTSYADKATVRNLTTNNATINLYAQWTIDKYTLTFGAGEGGSVTATVGGEEISSPATLEYNTKVVLTATPTGENAFARWVDGNGYEKTTVNPCTITITNTTIRKAEFNFPTTIYLEPSDEWKLYDARYAIYAWGGAIANPWVEMEEVGCEGEYFRANIPAGFTKFNIVRLKPGNGYDWNNDVWDQTSNLSVQANGKNLYRIDDRTFQYIHLKPNENWKLEGARFAAYFFSGSSNDVWVDMIENAQGVYTCKIPNGGHKKVIFGRMNPNADNGFDWNNKQIWNKTKDLDLLSEENCFALEDGAWGNNEQPADGEWFRLLDDSQWKNFTTPTYDVILEPFQYGQYGVNINGKTYYSKPSEQVVIENVALGTQVKVIDAVSNTHHYGPKLNPGTGNPWYDCSVVVQKNGTVTNKSSVDKVNGELQHTLCGHTTFLPNMVTTAPHRVYLHIPSNLTESWNKQGNYNYVWAREHLTNSDDGRPGALIQMTKETNLSDKGDGEYWYCDIPAGYNRFYFERKNNEDGNKLVGTKFLAYATPLNNINCYTLTSASGTECEGNLGVMPTSVGDYRLLYVEQVVEKGTGANDWKTVINRTLQHPSDIVKPYTQDGTYTDIVSLHIYKDKTVNGETVNPEVILQKCTAASYNNGKWTYTWEDIEAHMVNGPLEADAGMAMLPGRKNASPDSDIDDFVYDDGIEIIKNDNEPGRVWNFTIQQTVAGNTTATLLLDNEHLKPYEGKYYIRTNNAEGGWSNYTIPGSHMTFSSYAKEHSGYSHYYCKWVDIDPSNTIGTHKNVKFIVANDYGVAISEELRDDSFTQNEGTLQQNANVRWSWNETTNEAKRAYIQGSSVNGFLTASVKRNETTNSHGFQDNGNWIYESALTAKVGDQLTDIIAPYNGQNQELLEEKYQDGLVMLTGDENKDKDYNVRIMFDFKINKTTVFLVPNQNPASTAIDVLIERVNHEQATQVKTKAAVTAADQEKGVTVHAAMTFTKDNVANLNNNKSQRLFYWVSFPFDVRISEVFGFGEYGVHWIMQYYDGEERAKKGCWADSPTYWRYITDTANVDNPTTLNSGILKANQGYVLALATNIANMGVFTYTDQVSLYFPSYKPIKNINDQVIETAVTLPEYKCTINRPTPDGDRRFKDSNWHLIGIPSYADKTRQLTQKGVLFYYVREYETDDYAVTEYDDSAVNVTFQSMHSYFVQFAGTINWAEESWTLNAPEQMAAKRNANYKSNEHTLRVELQQSNEKADQTYITLQEEATPAFDMNKDLTKVINSGANIYSLITTEETPIEVAGNVLPVGESIIPLGVRTSKAGEYTFAMPDGTDGIIVELIDYETNTRTNMTLDEYTVNLGKGTFETRFALHVKPDKTVTSVEDINTNSDGVRKFIIDGVLYMQKDGMLYDAQGKLVR